jgi:hypothetical protein
MSEQFGPVRDLLNRVPTRWRRLVLLQATTRGALAGAAVVGLALLASQWLSRAPMSLAVVGIAALAGVFAALIWGLWPARHRPSDRSVARFIEERDPSLDERLLSAVDVSSTRALEEGQRWPRPWSAMPPRPPRA